MPAIAASSNPNLYGSPAASKATIPAVSAAAAGGQPVRAGTTRPINVSASVKSSAQLAGTCAPRKMPTAVLTCQHTHNVMPAPKKNQC